MDESLAVGDVCRVLEPPAPWTDGLSHQARVENFRGSGEGISVYNLTECPKDVVLASFYGHRSGPGPVASIRHLAFRESDVLAAGGQLADTPAAHAWPPEYCKAHRDILRRQDEVAEAVVGLCEKNPRRQHVTSRMELLRAIFALAEREDAPADFVRKARKRVSRLLRDKEIAVFVPLAREFDGLFWGFVLNDDGMRKSLRSLYGKDRPMWDQVAEAIPNVADDRRCSTG